MTAATPTSRHPSAAVLLRQLDGELDDRTAARLATHLGRCERCRARMQTMEARSGDVRDYVRAMALGGSVPGDRRSRARAAVRSAVAARRRSVRTRRGWAVAATVAGLMIVSLAVDPLRAWVLQRLALGGAGSGSTAAPVVALPRAVVSAEGSLISFQPASGEFGLQIEQAQAAGELFLQVLPVDRATAQITGSAGETMLVLPSGLRIENARGSRADYRVTLPSTVARVVLRVGNRPARVLQVAPGGGWRVTVPLAP